MNKKIIVLVSLLIVLILAIGVVAAVTPTSTRPTATPIAKAVTPAKTTAVTAAKTFIPIVNTEPIVNSWVYVNKAGKATTTHTNCAKRVSSNKNAASWAPTVVAYF